MRLFIAIPLPKTILQSLIKLQEPVQGIKRQKPGQMHLTLRFLGETPTKELPELKAELSLIQMKPFTLQIEGMGVFPDERSPRVVWGGVRKSAELMELQRKVETSCRRSGFDAENRPFKPHITFGRVKKASRKQVKSLVESEQAKSLSGQMHVERFNLYRSKLNKNGAVHSVVESYLLGE
jgi:2'-5' RNA ligase